MTRSGLEIINSGAPTKGNDKRSLMDSGTDTINNLYTSKFIVKKHKPKLVDSGSYFIAFTTDLPKFIPKSQEIPILIYVTLKQ